MRGAGTDHERPAGDQLPAAPGPVRVDVRRRRAGGPDPPARRARGVHRGLLRRPGAQRDRPGLAGLRVPVPQPPDGPVLHRGRRAWRHPGRALHLDRAGPGLGRVHHRAAVRRAERHARHRAAARPAPRTGLAVAVRHREGPVPVHGPPRRLHDRPAARAHARHGGGGPRQPGGAQRPGPGRVRRQHGHPGDARRGHLLPGGERRRGAASRSATGTAARARARPAGSRWSAR